MISLSVGAATAAFVTFLVGAYYLFLYLRFRVLGPEHNFSNLIFSLLCFTAGTYDLFCFGEYQVITSAQTVFWVRGEEMILAVSAILAIWFVSHMVSRKDRRLDYLFAGVFILEFVVLAVDRSPLTFTYTPDDREVRIGGHLLYIYRQTRSGPLLDLFWVVGFFLMAYIIATMVRFYRQGHRETAGPVLAGLCFWALGLVNDTLVDWGVYSFFYFTEFAFTGTLLGMSMSVVNLQVRAYRTLMEKEAALRQVTADLELRNLELQKVDRIKDDLVRNVSHELKTPVAKQSMHLELLKNLLAKDPGERVEEVLKVMEASIRRQEATITNLLDLARLESGWRTQRIEALRLDIAVWEVLEEFRTLIDSAGMKVEHSLEPVAVRGDREMLWHVFSNLVGNAIKFRKSPVGGRIDVTVRRRDRAGVAVIADDGIGMTAEEVARAFEKFWQASASIEGCGVGLTICQEMIERLQGSIIVDSPGPGRGTTFTVTIPLEEAATT